MRLRLMLVMLAASLLGSTGCLLNEYPSDPNKRMEVLINQSEDYRQMQNEWLRWWMVDQPSHMTYERVHGGIGP
jgi:hypothetical protein